MRVTLENIHTGNEVVEATVVSRCGAERYRNALEAANIDGRAICHDVNGPAYLVTIEKENAQPDLLERIAWKCFQNIGTLETRNVDGLDFHTVAVWEIREALEYAYAAGVAATKWSPGAK